MKFFNLFSILLVLSISCTKTPSEELTEILVDENAIKYENLTNCDNYIETQITSLSFINHIIEFKNSFIIGGADGFLITNQNYDVIEEYHNLYTSVSKIINVNNEYSCVCAQNGVFKIDGNLEISKLTNTPCTDMIEYTPGQILFVSGIGPLSPTEQASANILALNTEQGGFTFFTNLATSFDVYLTKIEKTSNGKIYILGSNASVYVFEGNELVEEYSENNIDFFPITTNSIASGYHIKVIDNKLFYASTAATKKILLLENNEWSSIIDSKNTDWDNEKEAEASRSTYKSIEQHNSVTYITTGNGIIRMHNDNKGFDFIKDLNISSTGGIQEVYVKNNGNLVLISPGNQIVEIKC